MVALAEAGVTLVKKRGKKAGPRRPPPRKAAPLKKALVQHDLESLGEAIVCRLCLRFASSKKGKRDLQQSSCRGQLGTWFDEFGKGHQCQKIGHYTVCMRCGAFGSKKPKRLKSAQCSGERPTKGHPRTCFKRLLEGKDPETGKPLEAEERWRDEAKARQETAGRKEKEAELKRKEKEKEAEDRSRRLRLTRKQPPPLQGLQAPHQAPLKLPRVRRENAVGQVHGPPRVGAGGPEGLERATSQRGRKGERKGGPEGSERAASSSGRC